MVIWSSNRVSFFKEVVGNLPSLERNEENKVPYHCFNLSP